MRSVLVLCLSAALVCALSASGRTSSGNPVALVTAEQQDELLAVELPSGKVLRRVSVPADPQNVAVGRGGIVVVSPGAGAVTLLDGRTLRIRAVLRGFGSPHIVAVGPRGGLAYVTDDARGELDVIGLGSRRVLSRLSVGPGAHHMALSPKGGRLWIALGEHAREISIVDLSLPTRPRLLRRFAPGFTAHDLAFSPDGRRVWVTSATADSLAVLNARSGRLIFRVPVGAAPQHIVFGAGGFAFATSGYSGRIVKIDPRYGRILASAATPRGSFNLSTTAGIVVTTSLLDGRVTDFYASLKRLRTVRVARAARGVALTLW